MGLILLLLTAMTTIYSILLLLACRDHTLLSSYEDLSTHCFGRRVTTVVEVSILALCFGSCIAYIVCISDITLPVRASLSLQMKL